jgi:hypothetical protein
MEKIAWKTYIIFTVWDLIQVTLIYFFLPETKGRTASFDPTLAKPKTC